MEIKQGDKVMVSKDAPRILFNRSICNYPEYVFEVREVEDGNADIYYGAGKIPLAAFVIPTKYLVKVDAEAKEAKYHKGDRVRHKRLGVIVKICNIKDNKYIALGDGLKTYTFKEEDLELIEPTEQTEVEKKPNVGSITIPVEVDLTDSYWDAYAADLAKEIVLKTVNSASDRRPMAIAEYAVSVAKAVVEGLKRK